MRGTRRTDRPGGGGDRVFDRIVDAVLDRALLAAVSRAGAPARIRFTERQLYYETCRVLRPVRAVPRRIPLTPAPPVPYERFEEALRRQTARGTLPGLLPPLEPELEPDSDSELKSDSGASRSVGEPDLYDYGLPRLLICQSRSVARMLLANDVHLEAACPVFAAGDLPLDPRLTAGLGRVEVATVHVLHDASVEGIALTARVRAALRDAAPGVRVASMGLVPRHAVALRLVSRRGDGGGRLRAALPSALQPRELEWLGRGRSAEVESVPPARLLRTVLRLVRGPRTAGHSVWTGLRELRTTGFMTWPTEPTRRHEDKRR
ncbi:MULTISPECIES: hypothetical protein [unclassified Streptomyces]|uniref:hypothetical protein n=1 Tax=unclassified Streptomyces TaxID=2593676 RepID=UPI00382EFCA2